MIYYLDEERSVRFWRTQGAGMNYKKEIIEYANKINIDLIRFTDGNELFEIKDIIKNRIDNDYISEFDSRDIKRKINSKLYLEDVKSIIVIAKKYKFSNNTILENYGRLSSIAIGIDYHIEITNKLNELVDFIKTLYEDINYKICVDTCDLADRQIAYKAGIGEYGKNNFIISKEFGSALNIGYIIIDKFFEPDSLMEPIGCKSCTLCIDACPTGALTKNGLNAKKCISELTQTKRLLTYSERELIDNRIYGCDICQKVCPKNNDAEYETVENSSINLFDLMNLTNKEFKNKFSDKAFFWRGNNTIKRNAIIAIGNQKKIKNFDKLIYLLEHQSETIRIYALWALYKSDSLRFLNINLNDEKLNEERKRIINYYTD